MTDIALVLDPATGQCDWAMANGDLQSGADLQSAILVSLFTDARVDDYAPPAPAGPPDRRGCWTDTYSGYRVGSRLWTRMRLVKDSTTLLLIEGDARDALAWLITCGAVASFDVSGVWVNRTGIALSVTAHRPVGTPQSFKFQWAWGQVN